MDEYFIYLLEILILWYHLSVINNRIKIISENAFKNKRYTQNATTYILNEGLVIMSEKISSVKIVLLNNPG